MKLNKKHATAKYCKNFNMKSHVHFAKHLFGCLVNCESLQDAICLAKNANVVLNSEYSTPRLKKALKHIEESINTFEPISDDLDKDDHGAGLEANKEQLLSEDEDAEPKTHGSNFHKLWTKELQSDDENDEFAVEAFRPIQQKEKKRINQRDDLLDASLEEVMDDSDDKDAERKERNRYFMLEYYKWLRAKLPYFFL